ncbi:2688_t:CDS:2, partial [Dentiscutata erythropus]
EETSHRENQSEEQRNEMDIPNDDLSEIEHEWVKVGENGEKEREEEREEEEEEELEELNNEAANLRKYHPAEHKDSKIKLRYLFTCDLSQPLFVRTLQQDDSMLFSD